MLNISGPQIKRIREQLAPALTQERLVQVLQSEGMRIDRSGVANIEGGYRKVSDVEIVVIAKVLGVTPDVLLLGTSSPSSCS